MHSEYCKTLQIKAYICQTFDVCSLDHAYLSFCVFLEAVGEYPPLAEVIWDGQPQRRWTLVLKAASVVENETDRALHIP